MAENQISGSSSQGVSANETPGDGATEVLALAELLQADESDPSSMSSHLQFSYDAEAGAICVDITNSSGTHKQSIAMPGVDVTAGGALSNSQIIQMLLAQGQSAKDI